MSVQSEINRIKAGKEDIRAAIAAKGQSVSATALLSSYGDKIRAIQTGTDTSDATAAAGDILSGKTAYAKGKKVTGTIAGRSAGDLTASGAAVTVPAGYYPSQVSKSVASAAQAAPSISVSSAGLITASVTQGAGYVNAGTKSAAQQLTAQGAKTVTPSASEQTAVPKGVYTIGEIKVAAIPAAAQATPSISVSSGGLITASATQGAGYVASGTRSATKQLPAIGAQTITPGTDDQTITSGWYLAGAQTIKGDANLLPANIKEGVSIFGVEGSHKEGVSFPAEGTITTTSTISNCQMFYGNSAGRLSNGDVSTNASCPITTYSAFFLTASVSGKNQAKISGEGCEIHAVIGPTSMAIVTPTAPAFSVTVS